MNLTKITKTAMVAAMAAAPNAMGVSAAAAPFCPESGVCFRWAVPEAAVETGSGNLYFQLEAPTSFKWVGIGIGSQMRNADMFVMYAASNSNNNVTMSTRKGTGLVMPQHVQRNDVDLLSGSGIANGRMTANVRCRGCTSAPLSRPTHWIAAWAEGSPIKSSSPSAPITYHDGYDVYTVDLSRATIRSDQNPFVGAQAPGVGGQNAVIKSKEDPTKPLVYAHGIIMTIVFAAGYPLGSLLMPIVGNWMLHASWQVIVFLAMWAGFGVGYVIISRLGTFFHSTHTQLGAAVCALMGLQPIFGWLHHMFYVRHKRRGVTSHVHIWYGRALMVIGIVNGGLGLKLAGNPRGFLIGYCVVAAVASALYMAAALLRTLKKPWPQRSVASPEIGISRENSVTK